MDTRVGTIELKIPKLTRGSYFPSLLEPRRRAERALHAVVVEAYVKGVSTRRSTTSSRRWASMASSAPRSVVDHEVEAFRSRPIDEHCPYVILDATFHKVRELDRVISVACVVAVGVTAQGERRVLGVDCGPSEDEAFWTRFLRGLVKRGLKGVRLVVSDAHEGLRSAIAKVLSGTQWQRCRVHFMRNLLSTVPRAAQETVAAFVRTIF